MLNEEVNELVRCVQATQDKQAFTKLYHHYAPRIYSFLVKNKAASEEAEEIAQEALMTLWQKSHLFDPEKSSLSTWLFRVARNKRIDRLRRKILSDSDKKDPSLFPEAEKTADQKIESIQWEAKMRAAIKSLPPEQSLLIKMAFFEGKTHSQISNELSLSLGTVKSRIRLAFSKLRVQVEKDYKAEI